MATVNDILTVAIPRSGRNYADTAATAAVELRLVVAHRMRALCMAGMRRNPSYFSATVTAAAVAGVISRPANCESVWRLERTSDGAEIVVVPYEEKDEDHGGPRVYQLGRDYVSVGGAGDPGLTENVRTFFAKRPAIPPDNTTTLDPIFPVDFEPLLAEEVALYLAIKDGRSDEVAALTPERNAWLALFFSFLDHETMGRKHLFHPRRFAELEHVPLAGQMPKAAA